MNKELLRELPKVDEVMAESEIQPFFDLMAREQVVDVIRAIIDKKRQAILEDESGSLTSEDVNIGGILAEMQLALSKANLRSLRPVVNATGVVLHTNLGRANLSEAAKAAVNSVASNYSTLEYDPIKGARGSRHDHLEKIITRITGAEACMVVNNNASATMLCMATLGRGREMIVSRGELVEIGGSFRIPDIMAESGATLVEIGTTNKTHLRDYEAHINENTAALLKVHTSNYKIIGFTEDVSVADLRKLGDKHHLPVIYDMGSGLMVDLSEYGINEPTVKQGLADGADVILFSGDKLLGGPQAGIIAGKKEYIDMMKSHPLARVVRVDKMTLSAMEATFTEYYDTEQAKRNIPVLRMLTRSEEELETEAEVLATLIENLNSNYKTEILRDEGLVGGGSAPAARLKNVVVAVTHPNHSAAALDKLLHEGETPVVARIRDDKLIFDMRTLSDKDYRIIVTKLKELA